MPLDQNTAKQLSTKLTKVTNAITKALPAAGKDATPAQLAKLASLRDKVIDATNQLVTAAGVPAGPPITGATTAVTPLATASVVAATEPDADGEHATFDEFFSGVATSFANAQHTLDQRTSEYLAEIKGRPELMPTAFRIAKVAADMKFAIEKVDITSVGVIFYKDTSSSTVQNQQSVHFEMVAAPTPPGAATVTPAVPLLLSASGRKQVLDIITNLSKAGDKTGSANLLAKPDRTLIFVESPDSVVYLAYADESKFGIWRLALNPARVTAIRPFGSAAGDVDTARTSLLQLGVNQETFLSSIS
ncbi:MAG TPA: hypothetical protein VE779_00260 [Candidatus Angelobacter sp.]|nr:hypothetical protein [Candidatus Angelobacter sp.]